MIAKEVRTYELKRGDVVQLPNGLLGEVELVTQLNETESIVLFTGPNRDWARPLTRQLWTVLTDEWNVLTQGDVTNISAGYVPAWHLDRELIEPLWRAACDSIESVEDMIDDAGPHVDENKHRWAVNRVKTALDILLNGESANPGVREVFPGVYI